MTISVEFTGSSYDLMVDSPGMGTMPAGCRLFRGGAWPSVKFAHATLNEANADAARLRAYLDALPKRRQTKEELKGVEA